MTAVAECYLFTVLISFKLSTNNLNWPGTLLLWLSITGHPPSNMICNFFYIQNLLKPAL